MATTTTTLKKGRLPLKGGKLNKDGTIRISFDLLPKGFGPNSKFEVQSYPDEKMITLLPLKNGDPGKKAGWVRKAIYSNVGALSPAVNVKLALENIQEPVPRKAVECNIEKLPDGTLIIRFGKDEEEVDAA